MDRTVPLLNATLDRLIWVLIYAGLFAAGLGLWLMAQHRALGWSAFVVGAAACVGGVVLIGVRSRR